jgi:hypothetical protein
MLRSGRAIGCCIHFVPVRVKGAGTVPQFIPKEYTMNKQFTSRLMPTLLLTLMLSACSGMQAPPAQKSLYERLGGQPAIQAVVDDFIGNVAGDARINGFFAHTNIAHLNKMLVEKICQATGAHVFTLGAR